jgi:uncharacterized protein (TIGR02996 family)
MGEPEAAFWAAIATAPNDDLPKLVFADWLDDRGDPWGACLRWVVAEHKQPAFDQIDTKTWDWWSGMPVDPMHYQLSPCEYVISLNLFTRLQPFGPGLWKGEPTFVAGLQKLCAAWRDCVEDGADPLADDRPRPESNAGLAAMDGVDV